MLHLVPAKDLDHVEGEQLRTLPDLLVGVDQRCIEIVHDGVDWVVLCKQVFVLVGLQDFCLHHRGDFVAQPQTLLKVVVRFHGC